MSHTMNNTILSQRVIWCAALVLFVRSGLWAQDDDKRRSELGERQRLVERNMAELESRFVRVAEALQAKEPERAKRLIETLQQAKERLIAKRMTSVTTLLDGGKLDQAEQELILVVEDLDRLVRMLLNDDRDAMSKTQEIATLEQWKKQLQSLMQEQNQVTSETNKIANKQDALQGLDEKIKQVEQLIKDQQALIEQTQQDASAGIRALDRLADKQFDIRQRTEALARELKGKPSPTDQPETDPAADPKGADGEGQAGDPKRAEGGQPTEKPQPADPNAKPKPADPNAKPQPSDPNAKPQAGESQPGGDASKPSENGESGQPASSAKKQPGQKPLENSMQHQKKAEENLTEGHPTDAQRDEQKALAEMQSSLDELNKERRRVASLPPEALAELAKQQRRTRGKTLDLAKDMAKAKRPSSDENSQDNPNAKQPGQQPVQEAEQAMDQAAGGLEEQEGQRAERQQAKSEKKLEEALREIEERLNQLREETRQEKLARLEARFSEMLTRQRATTQATIDLDDKKTNLAKLLQRDQLNMLRMATEETEISELGQQAYDLLLEDGTSSVFPECVLDLREDLGRVAKLLESERTDQLTQFVQREIETALEDLLESLKQAKKEGGGGGGGGGGGKQPLLRKSAELKMLKAAQLRVNRRTKQFESIRGEGALDPALEAEIQNISGRQSEITEMTEQVMEKKD